ncbi:MAG TPA: hypothetical protein VGH74_18265, partial [Planctomycetaceae bacterium]
QLPTPESAIAIKLSLLTILAVGLAGLAFLAVLTVLLTARRSILPMQQIKSVAVTLLWIVPALALVGLIGMRFSAVRVTAEHYPSVQSHDEYGSGIYDELRSTIRPADNQARYTQETKKAVSGSTSGHAEGRVTIVARQGTSVKKAISTAPGPVTEATQIVENPSVETMAQNSVANSRREARARQQAMNPLDSLQTDRVLKVAVTGTCAPDWADKDPQPNDKGILVPLSSQRFATLEEAAQQLTAKAVAYVKEFYQNEYPLAGDWTVPVSILERNAVREVVGEKLDQDFGNGIRGTMYRAHAQLELNSALRQGLHDSWHGQIVSHRLTVLGSMLGLMTLMLATSAGYFRLDDLTGGLYRRRLKFAAASLVAAGSLVALVIA